MVERELFWLLQVRRGVSPWRFQKANGNVHPAAQHSSANQSPGFSAECLSAIDPAAFELYQSLVLLWRNASANALTTQVVS